MARKLRGHVSYANVVASIALFVALGGGAYAAITLPKNSVGTKQIRKNAVNGRKVKNRSLTGADVRASTLGRVPLATHADAADQANNAATAGLAATVAAPEPWHEVGLPGEPPFESGASNPDPGAHRETVGFYKDREGVVHLKGLATFGDSGFIFTLPPGYRPANGVVLTFIGECTTCAPPFTIIRVSGAGGLPDHDGLILADGPPGPGQGVSLDGVTFRTEG